VVQRGWYLKTLEMDRDEVYNEVAFVYIFFFFFSLFFTSLHYIDMDTYWGLCFFFLKKW
jgi:hypothetical protein